MRQTVYKTKTENSRKWRHVMELGNTQLIQKKNYNNTIKENKKQE